MQIEPTSVAALRRPIGRKRSGIPALPRELREVSPFLRRPTELDRGPGNSLQAPARRLSLAPVAGNVDGLVGEHERRPRERLRMAERPERSLRLPEELQHGAIVRSDVDGHVDRVRAPRSLPDVGPVGPRIALVRPVIGRPAPDRRPSATCDAVDDSREPAIPVGLPAGWKAVGALDRSCQQPGNDEQGRGPEPARQGEPTAPASRKRTHHPPHRQRWLRARPLANVTVTARPRPAGTPMAPWDASRAPSRRARARSRRPSRA